MPKDEALGIVSIPPCWVDCAHLVGECVAGFVRNSFGGM
jgi:hypothetical protein